MLFLDFFAGVGGFRRGLELAGHKCIGFCEWDRFAAASYTSMHLVTDAQRAYLSTLDIKQRQKEILKEEYRNGEWYTADVRSVRGDNVPRADCWCFGAPCQDFSVAGLRKGLDGDRSSLVREVFRVLGELKEEDRPEWLIYENVKGMLSSNRGGDFLAIILEMEQLGYDIEWNVLNTKNFRIPQNRERVYTIGHLRSRGERKIFPLEGADGEDSAHTVKQICQRNRAGRSNLNQYRIYSPDGVAPCLNKMDGGGREPHIPVQFGIDYNVQGEESEIANCLKAKYDAGVPNFKHDRTAVAIPVLTPDRPDKRQNGRRFNENGEPSFTLTSRDRHGVAIKVKEAVKQGYTEAYEGDSINLTMPNSETRRGRVGKKQAQTLDCACNQGILVKLNNNSTVYAVWYEKYQCYIAIRKLTPRECFRLQGWTDDYFDKAQFVNSDSQLYKQAGNGVTVDVVYEIGKAIKGA